MRFELMTFALQVRRSNQLSYNGIKITLINKTNQNINYI